MFLIIWDGFCVSFGVLPKNVDPEASIFRRVDHGGQPESGPFRFFAPIDCTYHLNHICSGIFPEKQFRLRDAGMRYPGPGRCFVFVPKPVYVIICGSTLRLQGLGCASALWTEIASIDREILIGPSWVILLSQLLSDRIAGTQI